MFVLLDNGKNYESSESSNSDICKPELLLPVDDGSESSSPPERPAPPDDGPRTLSSSTDENRLFRLLDEPCFDRDELCEEEMCSLLADCDDDP